MVLKQKSLTNALFDGNQATEHAPSQTPSFTKTRSSIMI
jgi:hypothetical protein